MGIGAGAGGTLGIQAAIGNKEEAKDPELHGIVTAINRADSLINAAQGITGLSEQTETTPIRGKDVD